MKYLALATLCLSIFAGCSKRQLVEAPILIANSQIEMSSLKASRVVAYQFALPEDESGMPIETGFSLITKDGKLDIATLNNLKVAQATLTPDQVNRLVDSVYGPHRETGPAACYDPHHIFLFYDTSNKLINVVEVCFACINLRAQPQIEETQWYRHDFRELARICDEAEIGLTSRSAEEQIRIWDQDDRDFNTDK